METLDATRTQVTKTSSIAVYIH